MYDHDVRSAAIRWWQTRWACYGAVAIAFVAAIVVAANDPDALTDHETLWKIVFTLFVFAGVLAWALGGTFEFRVAFARGRVAFAEARYSDAAWLFGKLAERYVYNPTFAAVALVNAGSAQLYDGQHAAAIGLLLAANQRLGPVPSPTKRSAAALLVRCYALAGDVEQATRWLHIAAESGVERATMWELHGLVMCRRRQFKQACAHFTRGSKAYLRNIGLLDGIEAMLTFAFAMYVEGHGTEYIRIVREKFGDRSTRWLTIQWPELATFASTHGLDDAPAEPRFMN